jgi:hypothetical protein
LTHRVTVGNAIAAPLRRAAVASALLALLHAGATARDAAADPSQPIGALDG